MFRLMALAIVLALVSPAFAQQQPDPVTLQRAIAAIQQQRNSALDQAASAQIESQRLLDEVTKLRNEVEELRKAAPKPDK